MTIVRYRNPRALRPYTPLTLTATGGTAPYRFTAVLPGNMSISMAGIITGTPTTATAGFPNASVDVIDANNVTAHIPLQIRIVSAPVLTSNCVLHAGWSLVPYNFSLQTNGGGTAPFTYAITGGVLPSGLTLNPSTGVLSGTPTSGGTFGITVTVTDSSAPTAQTIRSSSR